MHKTKSVLAVVLALALALSCVILGGCGTKSEIVGINTKSDTTAPANTSAASAVSADEPATLSPDGYNKPYTGTSRKVEIDVKDMGVITVELDDTYAPLTVQNFLNLVNEGFYDGLTFHRIMDGFMIQGGDPLGTGTGGSTNKIKGEFSRNGVTNELKHVRGVISMARSNDPDSASSQFFIMHQDAPHLDGNYASFGKVTSGMEIVDKIAAETPVQDSNGTVLKADQPVINSIKIVED